MSATNPIDIGELQRVHGPNGLLRGLQDNQVPHRPRPEARSAHGSATDLPPIKSAKTLVEQNLAKPAVIVRGLLHQGSKMVLGGGSKSYKTWCLADLAVSVANGVPWWGQETTRGRVLYMNFEIQESFFATRLNDIVTAKGLPFEALENLDTWNLRGHGADLSELMASLLERIQRDHYSLIVVDPIYKCMGKRDENAAGDINTLLNEIERLAVQSGAAVVFGAHFSKGNQAGKESIDRISGSGVFARDPDSILIMTKHENEDTYTVEATLRNFAPLAPFCVRWNHPLMQGDVQADPKKLKTPGKKEAIYRYQQLLETLGDQELTATEWFKATAESTGMGRRTFYEKLAEIKDVPTILTKTAEGKWKAVKPETPETTEDGADEDGAEVQQVHSAPPAPPHQVQ